jgi:hypothetical protein
MVQRAGVISLMDVSPEDIAYVKAVFDGLIDSWVRFGRPLPASVVRARGILDRTLTTLTSAMSLQRQEIHEDEAESDSGNIGSSEVAELLGVTRRTVQRNAESLGARRVSGSWVFDRDDIGLDDG